MPITTSFGYTPPPADGRAARGRKKNYFSGQSAARNSNAYVTGSARVLVVKLCRTILRLLE